MTRTDVHAPSSVEFDPEAYVCYGVFDTDPEWGDNGARIQAVNFLLAQGFRSGPGSSSQCGHCGAHLRYAALMGRDDVKQYIFVGETCLDGRFEMTKGEFQTLREQARLNRERATRQERIEALYATYPVLVWGTYLHNMEVAGGREIIGDYYNDEDVTGKITMDEVYADKSGRYYVRNEDGFIQKTRTGWEFSTLEDIHSKALRYLEPSDKQVAFFDSLLTKLDTKAQALAQREVEATRLAEAGVEVPEGRMVIEGTVLSTKWVDNDFGGSLKMLVQHDSGWKVWGTVPASLPAHTAKGFRVRFTAKIERSADDALFGFYSRPTKAEVISEPSTTEEN